MSVLKQPLGVGCSIGSVLLALQVLIAAPQCEPHNVQSLFRGKASIGASCKGSSDASHGRRQLVTIEATPDKAGRGGHEMFGVDFNFPSGVGQDRPGGATHVDRTCCAMNPQSLFRRR